MADHRADVEDMDVEDMDDVEFDNIGNIKDMNDVAEYIRNVNEEQFANIRDEVFEVLDKMEVEEIMNKDSSDEEVLSDDTGCANDMNEYEMDSVEKFVSSLEMHMLNARIKHCVIQQVVL